MLAEVHDAMTIQQLLSEYVMLWVPFVVIVGLFCLWIGIVAYWVGKSLDDIAQAYRGEKTIK
jgi:hypothetical protein